MELLIKAEKSSTPFTSKVAASVGQQTGIDLTACSFQPGSIISTQTPPYIYAQSHIHTRQHINAEHCGCSPATRWPSCIFIVVGF